MTHALSKETPGMTPTQYAWGAVIAIIGVISAVWVAYVTRGSTLVASLLKKDTEDRTAYAALQAQVTAMQTEHAKTDAENARALFTLQSEMITLKSENASLSQRVQTLTEEASEREEIIMALTVENGHFKEQLAQMQAATVGRGDIIGNNGA